MGRIAGEGNYKIVLLLICSNCGPFTGISYLERTVLGNHNYLLKPHRYRSNPQRVRFTAFQLLMTLGVVKFLIEEITFKHTRIKRGPVFDRILIAGFMGVLILHAFHDRFGMRFPGSQVWGGRNYVNIFVGLAAYFVILSIPFDIRAWRKTALLRFGGSHV